MVRALVLVVVAGTGCVGLSAGPAVVNVPSTQETGVGPNVLVGAVMPIGHATFVESGIEMIDVTDVDRAPPMWYVRAGRRLLDHDDHYGLWTVVRGSMSVWKYSASEVEYSQRFEGGAGVYFGINARRHSYIDGGPAWFDQRMGGLFLVGIDLIVGHDAGPDAQGAPGYLGAALLVGGFFDATDLFAHARHD